MNSLIPINYDNDRQTVSARTLWQFLERPYRDFTEWFNQFKTYGFAESIDFRTLSENIEKPQGGRPSVDYEITVEMAKELCMLQRTEKGKQARQYFIKLEKQWNSPEAIMARAIKMADRKILSLQGSVDLLQTENKLLSQQALTWTNRKILEAIVKAYGASIHIPDINGFQEAWKDFKKELLYNYSININLRISKAMESSGRKTKPKTLSMIHDDELPKCISTAVALCKSHNVDISEIISKYRRQEAV